MIEVMIFSFATGCLLAGAGLKVGAFVERRNRSSGREGDVQRCLDTASSKLAWDRLATLLGPDARLERREGLPTMGDLRKAFDNELVSLHVKAATAGSVENLASADPRFRASVDPSVRLLEERSDADALPGDHSNRQDIWQACAWSVYIHRLATARLGEGRPAEPIRQGAYKAPIL